MNIRIFLFIAVVFIFSTPAFSANCSISLAEEENLLSLSYDEFDQTPTNGWRRYAELGCYHEMGEKRKRGQDKTPSILHLTNILHNNA